MQTGGVEGDPVTVQESRRGGCVGSTLRSSQGRYSHALWSSGSVKKACRSNRNSEASQAWPSLP